jgi:hypothetical protein
MKVSLYLQQIIERGRRERKEKKRKKGGYSPSTVEDEGKSLLS